jgi:RNA polymerase sigma-70 factor (ECF subfamily)
MNRSAVKRLQKSNQERKNAGINTNIPSLSIDEIYHRYADSIYTYLLHQVRDQNTAKDLFQEIMLKIMKSIRSYQSEGSLNAWLTIIARNHLHDYYRRKNRWRKLLLRQDENLLAEEKPEINNVIPFANPEKQLEEQETQLQLKNAIAQLPGEQQEVIDMHYNMQLTLREISQVLDCSINTVASRLRYALNKIKNIIEGEQ